MDLKSLDIEELIDRIKIVEVKLGNKRMAEGLLGEAFDHVPAIATLHSWICKVATSRKRNTPEYKELLKTMERDFLVLLALWEMETDENGKQGVKLLDDARQLRRMN